MKKNGMRPVPPGEILNEEFFETAGSDSKRARETITERGITVDTAIRLGTFFKTSAEFWMNLQMTYDRRNVEDALPARMRKSIEGKRSVLMKRKTDDREA
jgi:antitoxin HigA-1